MLGEIHMTPCPPIMDERWFDRDSPATPASVSAEGELLLAKGTVGHRYCCATLTTTLQLPVHDTGHSGIYKQARGSSQEAAGLFSIYPSFPLLLDIALPHSVLSRYMYFCGGSTSS